MSERPTPETDAARHDLSDYGSPVLCSWGDWVHVDVASKLERERDEAREEIEDLRHEYHGAKAMAGGFKDKIKSLTEQRDEAREAIHALKRDREEWELLREAQHDRIVGEFAKVYAERDEAQAERDILRSNKMSDPLLQTTFKHLIRERDEARDERDDLKQELEIVTARLHGKKHPLDNGIPEQHEIYIFKNGKYEPHP